MSQAAERVSLVTGGTDGIGRAVALELARGGDRVLFVGRDEGRGAEVLRELRRLRPDREHAFLRADLSLLSEAQRVCAEIERRVQHLDAAVYCAGILSLIPEWTEEGLERSFVLNYLSRYSMVRRLLPLMERAENGRVVLVANASKYPDTLDFDDLQYRRGKPGIAVAGRTQFANDLLTTELSERLRGSSIEVTCVFPGRVNTSVMRNARGFPRPLHALLSFVHRWTTLSPEQAARTPVFLARAPEARGTSGRFYGPHLEQLEVPERARHPDRRRQLWEASEASIGGR
jgi:NAD(P)-dependent dehydrogenase (short-subunit alcohol dehydrogenase family)